MLQAGIFEDFKGGPTLLIWGDTDGMVSLAAGLDAIRIDNSANFVIGGRTGTVVVTRGTGSVLNRVGGALYWRCSCEILDLAAGLIEPLVHQAGHQFMDVDGTAKQVIIARNEYPADLT